MQKIAYSYKIFSPILVYNKLCLYKLGTILVTGEFQVFCDTKIKNKHCGMVFSFLICYTSL